ncbi:MAG: TIGR04348 family glycosyltransferase [Rubrivivax sp.]|jgi:putative glycosyltransferase (TIGR04348 family)|nr:TIGR04348 family glycosyltransferase [Rubrivivax sp.]
MHTAPIVIVTPALADANNGNWQTARRWHAMLSAHHPVTLAAAWPQAASASTRREEQADSSALMIALHARRSAASIAAWREQHPNAPLVVALTGTDLYRDIEHDASAQRSLKLADALVVLNELGAQRLPLALRPKCRVVLQSCSARQALPHTSRHLRALMVGHLRAEKDPQTYFAAARRLTHRPDILLDHIGNALDPEWARRATTLAASHPRYRWLGGLPHETTRRRIQAAHVLVHPSRMEGGAHVVIEAVRSGTPVIASRIEGNVGLLGPDYGGYFKPGDDASLARLLERVRDDADMLRALRQQIGWRAPCFAPETEASTLLRLVTELLQRQGR